LIVLSSCSPKTSHSLQRLAVLPANVLIAAPASEWLRVAAPLVLQQDLTTSRRLFLSAVNDESAAYQIGATEIVRTTIENREGHISIQADLTTTATQQNREVIQVAGPSSAGFLPPLNALAKRLDERASSFSTTNDRALQAFTGAAEAQTLQSRAQLLTDALGVDPAFGLAHIVLAELAVQAGPQNVPSVLANANAHRQAFTPIDRARWDALAARLSHAPLAQQANADSAVLQLAPNDLDTLAALGSVRFLQNDAQAGQRLFASALALNHTNLTLQRQLAEGLFQTRKFADAEKIFVSLDNNPTVLPQLAVCILLEGDTARANAVFEKFIASRPPTDPFGPLIRANWFSISGRTSAAVDSLRNTNFPDPAVRAIAESQLAILQLQKQDAAAAKASAATAMHSDPRPASFGVIAVLLASGDAPPDKWRAQVDSSALAGEAKQAVLGYGLFLNGHYAEAAQLWQQVDRQSGDADLRARAMLAASLDQAGRSAEARQVVVQPFMPDLGDLYAGIPFHEMCRLLGIRVR
jgi:cytochrome c-type biogenesis protein CcmH/NrfG